MVKEKTKLAERAKGFEKTNHEERIIKQKGNNNAETSN